MDIKDRLVERFNKKNVNAVQHLRENNQNKHKHGDINIDVILKISSREVNRLSKTTLSRKDRKIALTANKFLTRSPTPK